MDTEKTNNDVKFALSKMAQATAHWVAAGKALAETQQRYSEAIAAHIDAVHEENEPARRLARRHTKMGPGGRIRRPPNEDATASLRETLESMKTDGLAEAREAIGKDEDEPTIP